MPIEIINTVLLAYIESLKMLSKIIDDIPKERREKAWNDWYEFWDRVYKVVGVVK